MQYNNNQLTINDKIIEFPSKIFKVTSTKSNIFILLGFDFDTHTHCNVYCLNQEGRMMWRIKERSHPSKTMINAYIGLRIKEGKYIATDFYNKEIVFNPFNGKIIGES